LCRAALLRNKRLIVPKVGRPIPKGALRVARHFVGKHKLMAWALLRNYKLLAQKVGRPFARYLDSKYKLMACALRVTVTAEW